MPDRYSTIVADPPWTMPTGGPQAGSRVWNPGTPSAIPYPTMTTEAIAALPVGDLASDNAHLYVWTTNATLEASYDIVRAWGFRPSQLLVWAKSPRGLGMGGAFTNTTEFVVFARRGSLAPLQRTDTTWWNWRRGAHSAKPDAFLDVVEQVSPGPYLEVFARRARFGWDYAGDGSLGTVEIPGLRAPGMEEAA
jgi:N6-adenosine-specific RNA methylase IME4